MKMAEWAGVILMCALVYWRAPRWCWGSLLALGTPVWMIDILRSAESVVGYVPSDGLILLSGSVAAGLVWAVALVFVFNLYKRRISRIYTSVWERIFLSHVRFISQALLLVSLYFLIHGH